MLARTHCPKRKERGQPCPRSFYRPDNSNNICADSFARTQRSALRRLSEFMNTTLRHLSLGILITAIAGICAYGQPTSTNQPTRVFRDQVEPHWFATGGETNRFWYRVNLPHDSREFILVDTATGKRAPAFDHARLAKALSEKTGRTIEVQQLPGDAIRFRRRWQSGAAHFLQRRLAMRSRNVSGHGILGGIRRSRGGTARPRLSRRTPGRRRSPRRAAATDLRRNPIARRKMGSGRARPQSFSRRCQNAKGISADLRRESQQQLRPQQ